MMAAGPHRSRVDEVSRSARAGACSFLAALSLVLLGPAGPVRADNSNTALGANALSSDTTGTDNTAVGKKALFKNTEGSDNTAMGFKALSQNTVGGNTAVGSQSLLSNTAGGLNTAVGFGALLSNTTTNFHTAVGAFALQGNTTGQRNTATGSSSLTSNDAGSDNTAVGSASLITNTGGGQNTAIGSAALVTNETGNNNTAVGMNALFNSTGSGNIAVGTSAGDQHTADDNNIDIGHQGFTGESGTIRIGTSGTHTTTFIAGIQGVTTGGAGAVAVLIDLNGQLGTMSSSARVKRDIHDMGAATSRLMELRPVTFRYRADKEGALEYGLIAEEVERIYPELVSHAADGTVETVRYHVLPAMLLNELQNQVRENERQDHQIRELTRTIEATRISHEREIAALEARHERDLGALKAAFEGRLSILEHATQARNADEKLAVAATSGR